MEFTDLRHDNTLLKFTYTDLTYNINKGDTSCTLFIYCFK